MSLYTKEFSLEFLTNLVNGPMFPPEVYTAYPSHQKIITAFEKIGRQSGYEHIDSLRYRDRLNNCIEIHHVLGFRILDVNDYIIFYTKDDNQNIMVFSIKY